MHDLPSRGYGPAALTAATVCLIEWILNGAFHWATGLLDLAPGLAGAMLSRRFWPSSVGARILSSGAAVAITVGVVLTIGSRFADPETHMFRGDLVSHFILAVLVAPLIGGLGAVIGVIYAYFEFMGKAFERYRLERRLLH